VSEQGDINEAKIEKSSRYTALHQAAASMPNSIGGSSQALAMEFQSGIGNK
jgi:hypothetical protein